MDSSLIEVRVNGADIMIYSNGSTVRVMADLAMGEPFMTGMENVTVIKTADNSLLFAFDYGIQVAVRITAFYVNDIITMAQCKTAVTPLL